MEKLVSIIIPAYNVERYIKSCLGSVIAQSYQNLEIIIVNDGSVDTTEQIIRVYEKRDSRIVVMNKQNGGLSSARNTGLARATGEYLIIFDSDDIMVPEKVQSQVAWLEQHPQYGMVYSNLFHFVDGTNKIYILSVRKSTADHYSALLLGNYINPNTVCMRRLVYEQVGIFDEDIRSAEDWDYWLRISQKGILIGYDPQPLTLYRMRHNSLSADHLTMCKTALYVLEKQRKFSLDKDQQSILASEIRKWHLKLKLAKMKALSISTDGIRQGMYRMGTVLVDYARKIKTWWKLSRVKDTRITTLLQIYEK